MKICRKSYYKRNKEIKRYTDASGAGIFLDYITNILEFRLIQTRIL